MYWVRSLRLDEPDRRTRPQPLENSRLPHTGNSDDVEPPNLHGLSSVTGFLRGFEADLVIRADTDFTGSGCVTMTNLSTK
jgi:hypothetical protein